MGQRGAVGIIKDKCRIRMNQYQMPTRELTHKRCNFTGFVEKLYHQQPRSTVRELGNSHSHDSCHRSRVNL